MLALCTSTISCNRPDGQPGSASSPLLIAAAANLSEVLNRIGEAFTAQTGTEVKFNLGATTQLAQQIEHGADFDLFLAADVQQVDALIAHGKLLPQSRAVYARGRVALWVPASSRASIQDLEDLRRPEVRFISIASPELAPYGAVAEKLLRSRNLWDPLQPKLVRVENVTAARQLAQTGNADAAFTAYSLVHQAGGRVITFDDSLAPPIDQALGISASSARRAEAAAFAEFVLQGPGKEMLRSAGYAVPSTGRE